MTSVDVTLRALGSAMHSGMFGGPAPDPVVALIQLLASLHDEEGDTAVDGLDNKQSWSGVDYPAEQFRSDANVLDGVKLMGEGTRRGDALGATIGDCARNRRAARDRLFVCRAGVGRRAREPAHTAGMDGKQAQDALVAHLEVARAVGYAVRDRARRARRSRSWARSKAPAFDAMKAAMEESFGRPMTTEGQGGSIPLCNVLAETYPDAEIMLLGVEEPRCLIHAPNESVDPSEIEHIALAEALFLQKYAQTASQ